MKHYREKGFNLLELMLALVVVTSVMLLAGHYYQVAKENTRVSQAVHLLNQIVDASFKYLEAKPAHLNQDVLPALVDLDLLPQGFKNNAQLSSWFTPVSVSYNKPSDATSFLEIVINQVPSKSCYQLINLMNKFSGTTQQTTHAFSCVGASTGGGAEKDFKGKFELQGTL